MTLKITRGDTTKGPNGGYLHPENSVIFDSEAFLTNIDIGYIPDFLYTAMSDIKYIYGLKDIIVKYISQNQSKLQEISSQVSVVAKNLKSQNINNIINDLKQNIHESLDQTIDIGSAKVKKIYILIYLFLAFATINNQKNSLKGVVDNTKTYIGETLKEVIVRPEKTGRVVYEVKPIKTSSVKFPKPSKKNPSFILPKNAITSFDTNGTAKNMLLPSIQKTIDGKTLCAKTAREAAETIYGSSGFIVKENYDGDKDAIGYYLRAQENASKLESEYPLFKGFEIANKISKNKQLPSHVNYDIDSIAIKANQFGILITTQSNLKITDGHQALVNNIYNSDLSIKGIYVYDPYLNNTIASRHSKLSNLEKNKFELNTDSDGYFVPLQTYLHFCEYKGRAPIGIMIYDQPNNQSHIISNKKIDKDIDIRESHFRQFNDIYPQVVQYINDNKNFFGNNFLQTSYLEDLANFSQESKLSPFAINKRGFKGIGQMNNKALEEVYRIYPFIQEKFGNKQSIEELTLEEMILASKIYKNGVIFGQLMNHKNRLGEKSIYEIVKKDDLNEFTLAAYNRGSNRLSKLLADYVNETGQTENISRADFEEFYLEKIAHRNKLQKFFKGYKGYVELFGEEGKKLGYVNSISAQQEQLSEFIKLNPDKYSLHENEAAE